MVNSGALSDEEVNTILNNSQKKVKMEKFKLFIWAKISEDKIFVSDEHRKMASEVIFVRSLEEFVNMVTSPDRSDRDEYTVDRTNWKLLKDKFGIETVGKWDLVCFASKQ